ncbi:MAG: GntR family transcriptional regulator [Burkholderiaceae bacterium]
MNKRAAFAEFVPAPSLTDRAYADLEELIITMKLAPGSPVSESDLSSWLGIGRTPIREALHRLARERLVTILPRRGIIVSDINVTNQLLLIEVRRELERLIARSAARRADDNERAQFLDLAARFGQASKVNDDIDFMRVDREFNLLCSSASHNEFAGGAMSLIHALSRRFWYAYYKVAADMPLTAALHGNIARHIAAGDVELAGKASDKLLDAIEKFTRNVVDRA